MYSADANIALNYAPIINLVDGLKAYELCSDRLEMWAVHLLCGSCRKWEAKYRFGKGLQQRSSYFLHLHGAPFLFCSFSSLLLISHWFFFLSNVGGATTYWTSSLRCLWPSGRRKQVIILFPVVYPYGCCNKDVCKQKRFICTLKYWRRLQREEAL